MRGFAPFLTEIDKLVTLPSNSTSSDIIELVKNETNATSNLTVKNFTTSLIAEMNNREATNVGVERLSYYVMFLPEGYNVTVNLPFIHPEWVLNYSYQGSVYADNQPLGFNIKRNSRKIRKLRPGDRIVLLTLALNQDTTEQNIRVYGVIKYLSKRN
jgi:hypothetical protein